LTIHSLLTALDVIVRVKSQSNVNAEIVDYEATLLERAVKTGLYNLTQQEAQAFVHFGPDRTENWLLVRLEKSAPEDSGGSK
jgi:hypothetical protein